MKWNIFLSTKENNYIQWKYSSVLKVKLVFSDERKLRESISFCPVFKIISKGSSSDRKKLV